jgi:hypothetical protein
MPNLGIARRVRHSNVDAVFVNIQAHKQGARFTSHGPTPATYGIAVVGPPGFT